MCIFINTVKNILTNPIVLSLFTAWLAVYFQYLFTDLRLTKRFYKLKGNYIQCTLDRKSIIKRDQIKLKTTITKVKRNVLFVEGDEYMSKSKWSAKILLDERFSGFGFGNYQYTDRDDCGRHEIQISDDGKTIFVNWTNTSHSTNNTGTLLWIKES